MTDQTTETGRRIVVGVDGSPGSRKALRWAIAQARLTGATVEAVDAWQDPAMYGYPMGYGWAPADEDYDMAAIARKNLDEVVAEVLGQTDEPVTVLTHTIQGHPAEVLIAAAAGAQALVVGTRGHGAFAGILLGSVSQHCVQHAPCPVTVVPE